MNSNTYRVDVVINAEWRTIAEGVTEAQSEALRRKALAQRVGVRVRPCNG